MQLQHMLYINRDVLPPCRTFNNSHPRFPRLKTLRLYNVITLLPKGLYLIANIFPNVTWLSPMKMFFWLEQKWSLTLSSSHCDHSFSAVCQQPPARAFHQMQPGNTFCSLTSPVISHGARNVFWKPGRNQGSITQRPHCLGSLIVFSSIAMVNLRNWWLTCSFHSSSAFGFSPVELHSSSIHREDDMETQVQEGYSIF